MGGNNSIVGSRIGLLFLFLSNISVITMFWTASWSMLRALRPYMFIHRLCLHIMISTGSNGLALQRALAKTLRRS